MHLLLEPKLLLHGAAVRLWRVVARILYLPSDVCEQQLLRNMSTCLAWRGAVLYCAECFWVQAAFSACPHPWNCGALW
jgi:hypothetical protein